MNISQNGVKLIVKWEGVQLKAYPDSAGVWTIGYGHTRGVRRGQTCTQAQAESWLRQDIASHITGISKYVKVLLNQNQFDALASFHYNLGPNILAGTDLLKYINSKQWAKAGNEMLSYCHAGGQRIQGLYNRRADERALFLKAMPQSKPAAKPNTVSTHTVVSGETLSGIAAANHTSIAQLQSLNHIKDANKIFIGQKLRLK